MPEKHLIDPISYISPEVLPQEHERIFRKAWHLVALTRDIPQEDDYIKRTIGQIELVIHRAEGRIVAYANVCPHRFSAFFREQSGNGPIRCPYHLWTFNGDGVAVGVPHRHGEALACYQTADLRLDVWQVDTIGELIFVSAAPRQSLREFLGPLLPELEMIADAVGVERLNVTQDIAADWKIVLQNTVEFEHAFSVHAKTFAADMRKPMQLDCEQEAENVISYTARMNATRYARPRDARVDAIFRRVPVPYPDGYRHHLIFPATTIGYTDNRQLAIMDYQPVGTGACRLSARLFDFKIPDLSDSETAMLQIVGPWHVSYTERLFAEG